jgi:hypothetical protein
LLVLHIYKYNAPLELKTSTIMNDIVTKL